MVKKLTGSDVAAHRKAAGRKACPAPLVQGVSHHPAGAFNGRGKYDAAICAKIPALYSEGQSDVEVVVEIGINRSTFAEWQEKYPEFKAAVEEGRALSHAWWEKLGRKGSTKSTACEPHLWHINMRNRHGWDKKEEKTAEKQVLSEDIINLISTLASKNVKDS